MGHQYIGTFSSYLISVLSRQQASLSTAAYIAALLRTYHIRFAIPLLQIIKIIGKV